MSLEDRRAVEFERSLWRDYHELVGRFDRLYGEDRKAFQLRQSNALAICDTKALLAILDVLKRRGALKHKFVREVGVSLLRHGRPQQAVDCLNDPLLQDFKISKLFYQRALAYAEASRFVEAMGAADEALISRPDFTPALDVMRQIVRLQVLQLKAERSADWTDWRLLVEACLGLRAHGEAARRVTQAMGLPLPAKINRVRDVCFVLDAGLSLGLDPHEVEHLANGALALYPRSDALKAIRLHCQVILGEAAAAAAEAAAEPSTDRDWRYAAAIAQEAAGDLKSAAAALGELCAQHTRDQEIRSSLAHCVGNLVLQNTHFSFRAGGRRRIINVFPFSDELDVLKIRLHEMADWVDQFVIVEAGQTFAGAPKPLHYRDNQDLFAEFRSKIIHLPLERFPDEMNSHWSRDFYQRDIAIGAIADLCGEEDLVYITDVDEIVDRRAVEDFDGDFARLHMPLHRFFLNYRPVANSQFRQGRAGAVWKAKHLQRYGLSYARFRLSRLDKDWARILDAGWHFSSMGDAQRIAHKHANYAHQETKRGGLANLRDEAQVAATLARLRAGEVGHSFERCEIDESFPRYIRQHQQELADMII